MTLLNSARALRDAAADPTASTRTAPKIGSSFTALTRQVHELGLMRRRYGYYWAKLIGAAVVLAAWLTTFVWIGDSWWQLAWAGVLAVIMTQTAFLGHDAAHRQIFKSGRWNDWISLIIANLLVGISYGWWQSKHTRHHANPNKDGYDPDIALTAIAFTPARATRHRSRLLRWLVAHQGWYFFPILLLEGISLHTDGIKRVVSRGRDSTFERALTSQPTLTTVALKSTRPTRRPVSTRSTKQYGGRELTARPARLVQPRRRPEASRPAAPTCSP